MAYGPITLRSNIDLHVEEGALVVFSKDFDDYPLILASFEGLNTIRCISPINGMNLENVAITGRGYLTVQAMHGDRLREIS